MKFNMFLTFLGEMANCIKGVDFFMYNSQEIANRVKTIVKQQNKSVNEVLIACELGKNTISKMANGTDVYSKNLAKIADYLDCSVDYLLGRTDNPNSHKS